MTVVLSLLIGFCGVLAASPPWDELAFYERLVVAGDWNERVYAVNRLGRKGVRGVPGIDRATRDPDWQVRLNAVHWLGRLRAVPFSRFEEIARSEACPWVRLAALHWLGRAGGGSAFEAANRVRENSGACRTWSWSAADGRGKRTAARSRTIAKTKVDDKGCQYVQFQKKRGEVCPGNTILRGIGMAPYKTKLGKGRAPSSGVALCCPGDPSAGPVAAVTGKPAEVECRLVPEQCPAGWTLLEPAKPRPWENRDYKYRRTHSHRMGDLNWMPCCRPHELDSEEPEADVAEEEAPQAAPVRSGRDYLAEEREFQRREELRAEEDGGEEEPEFDEREIARKLLGRRKADDAAPAWRSSTPDEKISNEDRVSEIDALIDAIEEELNAVDAIPAKSPDADIDAEAERLGVTREEARLALATGARLPVGRERLAPPSGPEAREEASVRAPAERFDPETEELPSQRVQRMRRELGGAEARLRAPRGPGGREEVSVRGSPEIVADHGSPEREHDAVPALIKRLGSKNRRVRARAAEQLGAMGEKGRPAIDLLRRSLRDRSPRVRSNAAIALGNLTRGSDEAVSGLKRLLDDRHPDVRYSAAQALGRIGTPAASRAFHKSMRSGMRVFLGNPSR
jgi:hypothetical protein